MATRWMPALFMVAVGFPASGQSLSHSQARFEITAHQVAQALSTNGIQTVDQQVSLLANVVATEPSPVLEILSVEPLDAGSSGSRREARSLVKLVCHLAGACLPFYSIVAGPAGTIGRASSPFPVAGNAALKSDAEIIIKPGAHATLVMDDARSHIQITVISLENGIAGHKIHVASPDHKQIYVGEVVSADLLKRSF